MLGGSTTSLLSILNEMDYTRFNVDLLLYRNEGPYIEYIPDEVNILPQACANTSKIIKAYKSIINGTLIKSYWYGLKYYKQFMPSLQQAAYMQAKNSRKLSKQYDVAIGFMELWSDVYVNKFVKANKKISWVHVDYERAHYYPQIDKHTYDESEYIVNVSEECLNNFRVSFPQYAKKSCCIENVLTHRLIEQRIQKAKPIDIEVDKTFFNLVTSCRIAIDHKGLDRGVEVIKELVGKGLRIRWYIIGEGEDEEKLRDLIENNKIGNNVIMLGAMECPFGLYAKFDAFYLPSRFEGKPMAVTEAQILALPPIVSNYSSAKEQINAGFTGFIAGDNVESMVDVITDLYLHKEKIDFTHEKLQELTFDNEDTMNQIYQLIER